MSKLKMTKKNWHQMSKLKNDKKEPAPNVKK